MKNAIISVISMLIGAVAGAGGMEKLKSKEVEKVQRMSDKNAALFRMMNQWVREKQDGKNLSTYFEERGYKKLAVYGMSYVGETFMKELEGTGVKVVYGIDKNADGIYADIEIFTLEDDWENVDAIVVTAVTYFNEIKEVLATKMDCPIISLEEVLCEI